MAQPPNLQNILATLAQLSQQPPQQLGQQSTGTDLSNNQVHSFSDRVNSSTTPDAITSNATAEAQTRPNIDPAMITSWQEGLRCVTKIAAQNKNFEISIRRMMKEQRQLELQWAADRNALKRLQANRNQSSANALSILKSLNSASNLGSQNVDEVNQENELKALDAKLYDKQRHYQTSAMLELKHLGVPFFGTPTELIVEVNEVGSALYDDRPRYSQPVTETELRHLQKKMISHLEDLYRD